MNDERTLIVKRLPDHSEFFDPRKLYASLYASCLSVRTPAGSAETMASKVCHDIETWLAKKFEVTSADIRRKASEHLAAYHPDAAYIYKNHRMML
jgi:transcriptional regulator NrdR family protein